MDLAIPKNVKACPVGIYLPGPRPAEWSDQAIAANAQLHAAHLAQLRRSIEGGDLPMAAPRLTPNSPLVALAVFREGLSPPEATALPGADPAIAAFRFEMHAAFFPSLDSIRVEY